MSPLLKNLIIALSITLVLTVAYILVGDSSDEAVVTNQPVNAELLEKSQKILSDTNKINSYRLDLSVLSDRRFNSLENTRVNLNERTVEVGRDNPFAPAE